MKVLDRSLLPGSREREVLSTDDGVWIEAAGLRLWIQEEDGFLVVSVNPGDGSARIHSREVSQNESQIRIKARGVWEVRGLKASEIKPYPARSGGPSA